MQRCTFNLGSELKFVSDLRERTKEEILVKANGRIRAGGSRKKGKSRGGGGKQKQ